MRPTHETKFLPISELDKYTNEADYFCTDIVFSPDTENDHFTGCPPYICIHHQKDFNNENVLFFEVPKIVAYYGKVHAGYTMAHYEKRLKEGERRLANKIKDLLNCNDE